MDKKGNKLPETRVKLHGFGFAPGVTSEDNSYREQSDSKGELFGPFDADLKPTDRVELPAPFGKWSVEGEPARWLNPINGKRPGSVTRLTRQEG